jgi:predicted HTH transcriptional regulator
MGKQISLSERQIGLIEYLENHETMTMNEAREMVPMVSDDTLLRDLTDLIKKGLIKKQGKTKGARYVLKAVHG